MYIDTVGQLHKEIDALNEKVAALSVKVPLASLSSAQKVCHSSHGGFDDTTYYASGIGETSTSKRFANNGLGNREQILSNAVETLARYEADGGLQPSPDIYFTLGNIYMALSAYPESFVHYCRALDMSHECLDYRRKADALNHIGIIYSRMGDIFQAEEVYERARIVFRDLGDRNGEAVIYNNRAMTSLMGQEYDAALMRAQRALQLAEEFDDMHLISSIRTTIAEIYMEVGSLTEAEQYLQRDLAAARTHQFASIEMNTQLLLGKLRNLQQKPKEALPYLQAALAKANEISLRQETAVCHHALAKSYKIMGEFEQALSHFELYHCLQQEIFNRQSNPRLHQLPVIHHIKSVRQTAEIFQRRNEELQKEIMKRARGVAALQKANRRLRRQNEELDAYAHTVAHDLKQPLTAVGMHAEILNQYGEHLDKKRFYRTLIKMKQASDRAIGIVDNLLLLATIADQKIELQSLQMADILENVRRELKIENGQITYTADSWPLALGYAPWVEEVWINYISNGLKYGGSPPQLQLGANKLEDGMVRFWIKDNGPGLSKKDQDQLFIPFNRLHEEKASGYGLGLSIVRRIIQRLDGEVGVESALGQGSTFYFTLPGA